MPPERNRQRYEEIKDKLEIILTQLKDKEHEILIIGDINSKPAEWGNKKTDRRGKEMLEVIENNELIIINKGNDPTYESTHGTSCIDITLASEIK